MINLNKIIENRAKRIMFLAQQTTKKIVKREFNKFKREIIKGIKGF